MEKLSPEDISRAREWREKNVYRLKDGVKTWPLTADEFDDYLAAYSAAENERLAKWRCFHCEFETSDEAEARAHFGEDLGEQAICVMWSQISKDDHLKEYQGTLRELEGERKENIRLRQEVENLEQQRDGNLAELSRYFGDDCTSVWVAGDRHKNLRYALEAAEAERDRLKGALKAVQARMVSQIRVLLRVSAEYWKKNDPTLAHANDDKARFLIQFLPEYKASEFAKEFAEIKMAALRPEGE